MSLTESKKIPITLIICGIILIINIFGQSFKLHWLYDEYVESLSLLDFGYGIFAVILFVSGILAIYSGIQLY